MKIQAPHVSKKSVSIFATGSIFATALAYASSVDASQIVSIFSDTAQSQIAQAGFFFTLAAWLHSGRVKKEIKSNFEALTIAINKVADAFREDLKRHGDRLDNLASRVEILEHKNPQGE